MTYHPDTQTVLNAITTALGRDAARAVPARTVLLQLSSDANLEAAIAAVRAAVPPQQLRTAPVTLWHGPAAVLIGPLGALTVTDLMHDPLSQDLRVHPGDAARPARIVLSWVDGPSREQVAQQLATQPPIGLPIELVHERFETLLDDVFDAALTATGTPAQIAAHPVLERFRAVPDGEDTYYGLLDIVTALVLKLDRHRDHDKWFTILGDIAELADQTAVDAVLDDLDTRLLGGQFFPVHSIDDHAMLSALFVLLALTAQTLGARTARRVRRQVEG